MGVKNIIKKDNYKDSVFLMSISGEIEKHKGVNSVSLMMGTQANKEILAASNLLTDEGEAANENDLIIALDISSDDLLNDTLDFIEKKFNTTIEPDEDSSSVSPTSISNAVSINKNVNLALISVPGQYAAREAMISLDHGLHVMLFSDNVSLEDEIRLKKKAFEKDLLLMGPDCGTAIINGIPLGFANAVPSGDIGIVAASGTGMQEVSVTIAKYGSGITQAFGTGGRDLKKEVGALTMLQGLTYLIGDEDTRVIVLISKPPHPTVAEKVLKLAKNTSKPVVVCFLGSQGYQSSDNIIFTANLERAGIAASYLSQKKPLEYTEFTVSDIDILIDKASANIKPEQKYLRGLYSGGTLCDEALDILRNSGINSYSNAGNNEEYMIDDPFKSRENCLIDMGEDIFTRGRPHPMIDLNFRNKRIIEETEDTEVAVILFDVVLGYGSNPDPASSMKETLNRIKGSVILVSSVCGTDLDPQNYSKQVHILKECGVIVLPTNAQAARFAAKLIKK